MGVGLPEFQSSPFGGGSARTSLASKEWDAFTFARDEAIRYLRDGGSVSFSLSLSLSLSLSVSLCLCVGV